MKTIITGRNHLEITDALKTFISEKMQRVQKRLDGIDSINIVLHVENITHIAEGALHIPGAELHAKSEAEDMYAAIDLLVDKLIAQITKHKEKTISHRS